MCEPTELLPEAQARGQEKPKAGSWGDAARVIPIIPVSHISIPNSVPPTRLLSVLGTVQHRRKTVREYLQGKTCAYLRNRVMGGGTAVLLARQRKREKGMRKVRKREV